LRKLKAVILVGGPGTRLRPLTNDRPKSVLPVLNRPFMEHVITFLERYGVREVILTLNYLPDIIRDYLGDGSRYGVRLNYCTEEEPLGTAGAVKNAAGYLHDTFIVMNGDIFADIDLADMLAFHRDKKAKATIYLTYVDDPSAFGVVETDSGKRVKQFIEKPPLAEARTNWINAGIYILEPEVLEHIPKDTHYMFEKGLFPNLLDMGSPVYGYPYRGYWLDMGTPGKYFSLNIDLMLSKIASPLVSVAGNDFDDADIDPAASVTSPVIIGSGSRVEAGVNIKGPVVMGRGCHLGKDVVIENTILWDNVSIGAGASLDRCIVSSGMSVDGGRKIVNGIVTPAGTAELLQ
jgi:mannose-1-phosphate guanylyltransferase